MGQQIRANDNNLMNFLVRKFSLDSDDQQTVRTFIKNIQDEAIKDYCDRIKPEMKALSFTKKEEQMSGLDRLYREFECRYLREQSQQQQDDLERHSD